MSTTQVCYTSQAIKVMTAWELRALVRQSWMNNHNVGISWLMLYQDQTFTRSSMALKG